MGNSSLFPSHPLLSKLPKGVLGFVFFSHTCSIDYMNSLLKITPQKKVYIQTPVQVLNFDQVKVTSMQRRMMKKHAPQTEQDKL
jgi:hypothetical protein